MMILKQKHCLAIHKPWPYMGSLGLLIHDITAKLRAVKKIEIPTGYQDETGFHPGVKPADKEIKWPPVW